MRIYIAAPWKHRDKAKDAQQAFQAAGFAVISRWIDFHGESTDPAVLAREAKNDWEDLLSCDVLIVLNIELSEGKATEQGVALQAGIPIVGVGEPSVRNIFGYLPHYTWVPTVQAAIEFLR
jgi:hypothetical protein